MNRRISKDQAPALGDIRCMKAGDTIVVDLDSTERKDWTRYQDAIRQAMARGANVIWPVRTPIEAEVSE